ncbi:DUF4386 domain-containing protein [Catenuloplanes japonicus]|uniref:DUF4386 domain-containing protein n=1 Tax=Catenuloplanes japonicus TaxID=33876 RepID=UPI000525FAB4|nr:DUF4386 domain-containing protein [Catenuloplanes japonicus]
MRITGLLYLALAVAGGLGFLTVRPRLFADGDPAATLANLTAHPTLVSAGIALELLLVLTQSLCALWFYRLFRRVDSFAAGAIAAFGLINAVAVLGSAATLGAAAQVADAPFGDAAAVVQTLYLLGGNLWTAGSLFFGLWLIPMGACVLRAGMPRVLGWLLIAGGVLYVVSAFTAYLVPGPLTEMLAVPASIGEFWMIFYLIFWSGPKDLSGGAESRLPSPRPAPSA